MLVCSLFARLPRYGPSAAGIVRHRDSARLGPGVHEPAARDSLRYRLIPRRVVKIGLLIRGSSQVTAPCPQHGQQLHCLHMSWQPFTFVRRKALETAAAPPLRRAAVRQPWPGQRSASARNAAARRRERPADRPRRCGPAHSPCWARAACNAGSAHVGSSSGAIPCGVRAAPRAVRSATTWACSAVGANKKAGCPAQRSRRRGTRHSRSHSNRYTVPSGNSPTLRVIHASLQKCRPITAEIVVVNVSIGRR